MSAANVGVLWQENGVGNFVWLMVEKGEDSRKDLKLLLLSVSANGCVALKCVPYRLGSPVLRPQ